jgi:hypothetical protein
VSDCDVESNVQLPVGRVFAQQANVKVSDMEGAE